MELDVEWTDLGVNLSTPGGSMVFLVVDRVRLATPDGPGTYTPGIASPERQDQSSAGTQDDLPAELITEIAAWTVRHAAGSLSAEAVHEESMTEPEQALSVDVAEVDTFDPMRRGGRLADYLAFVMSHSDLPLPLSEARLGRYLRTRTACQTSELSVVALTEALELDPRFERWPGKRWGFARFPMDAAVQEDSVWALAERANTRRADPSVAARNRRAAARQKKLFMNNPDFDPMSRHGQLGDYVAFVMAQPDVQLPTLLSTVGTLLRTRTAVYSAETAHAVLAEAMKRDRRFRKVDDRLWTLRIPRKPYSEVFAPVFNSRRPGGPVAKSAAEYIAEVLKDQDTTKGIEVYAIIDLLLKFTDINPERCTFKPIHSALTRDSRFELIDRGLWRMMKPEPLDRPVPAEPGANAQDQPPLDFD